jgi:hypothetical protein
MSEIVCGADPCPVILNSTCVFYRGQDLLYIGVNTNDPLQTVIEKINQAFQNSGLGYAFNNGLVQTTPFDPVQLGGSLIQNTTIGGSFTLTFVGNVQAARHITTGGTSSQFVKGDGTLDSTSYQPAGNYLTALSGDGSASGPGIGTFTLSTVNFSSGTFGSSTLIPIVTVNSKGLVTNVTTTSISVPAQSLSFIGDVVGSGVTGTNVTLSLQNVNSNVYGSNTFLKFAVNAKGLVTSATPVGQSDIISALGYTPVSSANVYTQSQINSFFAGSTPISGYNKVNWDTAYGDTIVNAIVSGGGTKTLILYQQDGGTITTSWTESPATVSSVFGRVGAVIAQSGDYNTSQVTESTNLYFTEARVLSTLLSGYISNPGTITSADSILSAIQKLNGNISSLTTGVSSVSGTSNRITASPTSGAVVVDIASTYAGQSSITTLGTITSGIWQGTAIADSYISSASVWNAKQNALTFGNLTEATSSILTITGGTGAIIGSGTTIQVLQASGSQSGFLSSTDWTTFNGKQNALTNPITGTGTSGQVAFFNGTSTQTGSSTLTFGATSPLSLSNSVTASSLIGRGANFIPTLVASANFDELIGLQVNPTFNNGAFVNTTNEAIRANGNVRVIGAITASGIVTASVIKSTFGLDGTSNDLAIYNTVNNTGFIRFLTQTSGVGVERMRIFQNGNVGINTGATDAGFRLDVNGTARVQGELSLGTNVSRPNFKTVNIGTGADDTAGSGLRIQAGDTTNTTGAAIRISSANNFSQSAGAKIMLVSIGRNVSPSSGSAGFVQLDISPSINQTGGANGITRGIFLDPTLTSAFDFRAIEITRGNTFFGTTSGSVGIGANTSINASAILDITSTTQGFLPPRLTTTERNAIATPATGLQLYNSTSNTPDFYNGTSWVSLQTALTNPITGTGASGQVAFWNGTSTQTGDNGLFWDNTNKRLGIGTTSPATATLLDVVGTIKANTLRSDILNNTANTASILVFSGTGNRIYDNSSTQVINIRNANVLIQNGGTFTDAGFRLDVNGTARVQGELTVNLVQIGLGGGAISTNTRVGVSALNANTTGTNNIAIGDSALAANTTGSVNVAIGRLVMNNSNGNDSVGIGNQVLTSNTGSNNIGIGRLVLLSNTSGASNIAINRDALRLNTTGSNNIGIGQQSLNDNTTGSSNVAVGRASLSDITTTNSNTAIGNESGRLIADGSALTASSNSVFIGSNSRANANSETNQIVIGHEAIGLGSNTTVIGNSSTTFGRWWGNLLIGTSTNSTFALDVNGTARVQGALTVTTGGASITGNVSSTGLISSALGFNGTQNDLSIYNTTNDTGFIRFLTQTGGVATERMRIFPNGNIVIDRTTDAGFRFDVAGTARIVGRLTVGSLLPTSTASGGEYVACNFQNNATANNTSVSIKFDTTTSVNGASGSKIQSLRTNTGSSGAADLIFYTSINTSTLTEVLRIKSSLNVLIGTTTDVDSSILTLESTTKGFLPPRMTSAQRDAIVTPAAGLVVYNTTDNLLSFYNGTAWANL